MYVWKFGGSSGALYRYKGRLTIIVRVGLAVERLGLQILGYVYYLHTDEDGTNNKYSLPWSYICRSISSS